MANAIKFTGANMRLLPPQGAENVDVLHTYTNGSCSVFCLELSSDELAEVLRTGCVFLTVLSGQTQPPVFIGSETTVRSVVVDYGGVWARERRAAE